MGRDRGVVFLCQPQLNAHSLAAATSILDLATYQLAEDECKHCRDPGATDLPEYDVGTIADTGRRRLLKSLADGSPCRL